MGAFVINLVVQWTLVLLRGGRTTTLPSNEVNKVGRPQTISDILGI